VAPLVARDARVVLLVGRPAAATAAADARVDGRAGASAATGRAPTTDGPTSATFEGSASSSIISATPAFPEWAIGPATGRWEAVKDLVHERRHTSGSESPAETPAAAAAPRTGTPAAAAVLPCAPAVLPRAAAAAVPPLSTTLSSMVAPAGGIVPVAPATAPMEKSTVPIEAAAANATSWRAAIASSLSGTHDVGVAAVTGSWSAKSAISPFWCDMGPDPQLATPTPVR